MGRVSAESDNKNDNMVSTVEFGGQSVCVHYPASLTELAGMLLAEPKCGSVASHVTAIRVTDAGNGKFNLIGADGAATMGIDAILLPKLLKKATMRALVAKLSESVAVQGGLVCRNGTSILLAGKPRSGGPVLSAWMAGQGYTIHTGDLVALADSAREPATFSSPLIFQPAALALLKQAGIDVGTEQGLKELGIDGLLPLSRDALHTKPGPIKAVLFPQLQDGARLEMRSLGSAQTALRLFSHTLNTEKFDDGGLGVLSDLARCVPAVDLMFGDLSELGGVLDDLIAQMSRPALDTARWHRLQSKFVRGDAVGRAVPQKEPPKKINPPTPRRNPVTLTIGMATYDDFDGVYFTIQALRLNNRELESELEFLVVDNHPEGPCGDALKAMESISANYRYVPYHGQSGTAVRDIIFSEAAGEYVMCLDCHVLLEPGVLGRLCKYITDNPDTMDLLQGPLIDDSLATRGTHFDTVWSEGMYGTWAEDPRGADPDAEPFDIPSQGLGLFVSRRDTWPGFNLKFRGFGGEEGYIHEKFRQRGDRTLCLPFLRWLHRFPRPQGVPYEIKWEDRIRNYMIGFRELGLDENPITEHFADMLGEDACNRIVQAVDRELDHPLNTFAAIRLINLDSQLERRETMERRFRALGIERLVNRLAAVETPYNHHIGCALSHRAIIEDAWRRKLRNVLVFEDDAIFHRACVEELPRVLEELQSTEWDLLYLGGRVGGDEGDLVTKGGSLRRAPRLTCSHAIAYNSTIFDQILDELPANEDEMAAWISKNKAIDHYLFRLNAAKFVSEPMLAMQVELFGQPKPIDRNHYND